MRTTDFYAGIEHWRDVPFEWKTANCCHYVKDMLERQGCHVDLEVPEVMDAEEAQAWLEARGHSSLYHLALKVLGRSIAPLQASRGDVVYDDSMETGALGIVDRQGLFLGPRGLISVPLPRCRRAFRVPHG